MCIRDSNTTLLTSLFDNPLFLKQYQKSNLNIGIIDVEGDPLALIKANIATVTDKISRLQSISEQIDFCSAPSAEAPPRTGRAAVGSVIGMCRRFPTFVR